MITLVRTFWVQTEPKSLDLYTQWQKKVNYISVNLNFIYEDVEVFLVY